MTLGLTDFCTRTPDCLIHGNGARVGGCPPENEPAATGSAPDHLLDASRHLRPVIEELAHYPEFADWAGELAEVDAAIGRALKGRPTTRVAEEIDRVRGDLCIYMDDAMRALAARIAPVQIAPGTAGPRKDEPPTQATALRAAELLTSGLPRITVEVDCRACVDLNFFGDADGRLAAVAANAARLTNLRELKTPCDEHTGWRTQVYITGDYPGTREVRLVAVLAGEPDPDILGKLRAICGDETAEVPA